MNCARTERVLPDGWARRRLPLVDRNRGLGALALSVCDGFQGFCASPEDLAVTIQVTEPGLHDIAFPPGGSSVRFQRAFDLATIPKSDTCSIEKR